MGFYQSYQNCNMTHDANKGLTIAYNFLNLPHRFVNSEGTMTVNYDAAGVKWNRTVSGEGFGYTQWYIDGIEYRTEGTATNIEAIYNEAGRYVYADGVGSYEYTLRDHLGNARVTFADANADGTPEPIQESHFYPFGMAMESVAFVQSAAQANPYKYSGKESVTDLGIDLSDFGARWYDAAVGRWWSVDAMAEVHPELVVYRYCGNNPIKMTDPTGNLEIEHLKSSYPAFYDFLSNIGSYYMNKPQEFKNIFKEYSQLSDAQVKEMLTNGKGPKVEVAKLKGALGSTPMTGSFITIDISVVDYLQANYWNLLNGGDLSAYYMSVLLAESTLFHELTHYGDLSDGKLDMTGIKKDGTPVRKESEGAEGGKAFERRAYGGDINFDNVRSFINQLYNIPSGTGTKEKEKTKHKKDNLPDPPVA